MLSKFVSTNGTEKEFDLDNVYEIIRGYCQKNERWTSMVIFEPKSRTFIELRSSPADVRGVSKDEAEEVSVSYVSNAYGISIEDLDIAQKNPKEWTLIDQR